MNKKQKSIRTIRFDDSIAQEYDGTEKQSFMYRIDDTDELVQVEMAYGELMERESVGGFIKISENSSARRALNEELKRDGIITREKTGTRTRAKWPMVSVRAGVNPNQRKELTDFWAKHDVRGCEVLPNGDVQYDTRAARKADHEARGLFDRSGGYGDAMPKNL